MSGKSPGWYPDPSNNLQERLWDGKEWVPFKVRPANTDLTFKDVHNAREPGNADTVRPDKSPVENPSTGHKKVKYVLVGSGILFASVSLLLLVLPSLTSRESTLFRASTTLRLILGNALLLAGIALLVTGRWRKMLHETNISNGAKRGIILLLIVALLFLRRM